MMPVTTAYIWEQQTLTVLARIRGHDGQYPLLADISSITARVFNTDTAVESTPAPTLVVADCYTESLRTDATRWHTTPGYNLSVTVPGSLFVDGNETYQVEIEVAFYHAPPVLVVVRVETSNLYSR